MNFHARMHLAMARTGKTYRQLCQEMGSAGGRKAAANKRRQRESAGEFHVEQERQVAMKLKDADEVLTPMDRFNITMDQNKRRVS